MKRSRKGLRRRYGRRYGRFANNVSSYRYKGLVPVQLSQGERGLWYARAVSPNGQELVVTGNSSESAQHQIEWEISQKWRGFDKLPGVWS